MPVTGQEPASPKQQQHLGSNKKITEATLHHNHTAWLVSTNYTDDHQLITAYTKGYHFFMMLQSKQLLVLVPHEGHIVDQHEQQLVPTGNWSVQFNSICSNSHSTWCVHNLYLHQHQLTKLECTKLLGWLDEEMGVVKSASTRILHQCNHQSPLTRPCMVMQWTIQVILNSCKYLFHSSIYICSITFLAHTPCQVYTSSWAELN